MSEPIVIPEDVLDSADSLRRWAATYPPERRADVRIALTAYLDTLHGDVAALEQLRVERTAELDGELQLRALLRCELNRGDPMSPGPVPGSP